MCNYTASRYTACACVTFHLEDSGDCFSRSANYVVLLQVSFDPTEAFSQINLQRYFDEVYQRPIRHIVSVEGVFAPTHHNPAVEVAKDSVTPQVCPHAKVCLKACGDEPGMCMDCLLVGEQPTTPPMDVLLYQRKPPEILQELTGESGLLEGFKPDDIWLTLKAQQKRQKARDRYEARRHVVAKRNAMRLKWMKCHPTHA